MTSVAATATVVKSSAASGRPQRPRAARPGPPLRTNSLETKRLATAVLEVLAGVRTQRDAAKTLNISLPRYYLLEQRALTGLLAACEPRTKGPRRSSEREIAKIQRQLASCQRECARQQSLLRGAASPGTGSRVAVEIRGKERGPEDTPQSADRAGVTGGAGHRAQLVWAFGAGRSTTLGELRRGRERRGSDASVG